MMGYDSGRIAAEDEYIRRELAETTSFCNAFWVSDAIRRNDRRDVQVLTNGTTDREMEKEDSRLFKADSRARIGLWMNCESSTRSARTSRMNTRDEWGSWPSRPSVEMRREG